MGCGVMATRIILHGGAGSWRYHPVRDRALEVVRECTRRAYRVLLERDALEAVVSGVKCMEDSGYLNAGWGSVPDLYGGRSLDAGVMTSGGLVGAVASITATKNPVVLARIVAEDTPHILIGGEGGDLLARQYNLPPLPPPPSHVWSRYRETLKRLLGGEARTDYGRDLVKYVDRHMGLRKTLSEIAGLGDTVGAVALDEEGLLASAVSTGGMILKLPGRIGDSPIPGAGFYASGRVACSATGYGERIIMTMPCLRLAEYMQEGLSLDEAMDRVMEYVDKRVGGNTMGFIAVDEEGNLGWRYNTEAMLIGYIDGDGNVVVKVKP